MISATGFRPVIAAPIAAPRMASSEIGRVLHPPRPELFEQSDRGLEHATRGGRVLAEEHHALIAPHFLRDARGDRVPVAQLRHALPPSAHTSVIADSSAGVGEAFAVSVA